MEFLKELFYKLLQKHRRLRRIYRTFFSLACIVVFVTTYALILPALTIDRENATAQTGMKVAAMQHQTWGSRAASQDQSDAAKTTAGSEEYADEETAGEEDESAAEDAIAAEEVNASDAAAVAEEASAADETNESDEVDQATDASDGLSSDVSAGFRCSILGHPALPPPPGRKRDHRT